MSFLLGDRVRDNFGRSGRITSLDAGGHGQYIDVEYDADVPLNNGWYKDDELQALEPEFVHVQVSKAIWVTLPGDTAGHKLTNDEALTLLRQLEEALS